MNKLFSDTLLILVALLTAAAQLAANPMKNEEIDALLSRLIERQNASGGMTAEFTEARKLPLLTAPVHLTGRMEFRPPTMFRREVDGPAPSTTVGNGQELQIFFPAFSRMEVYDLASGSPVARPVRAMLSSLDFSALRDQFQIAGESRPDGSAALTLTPRARDTRKFISKVTLDLDASLEVERSVIALEDGTVIQTDFSKVSHGPIGDDRFRLVVPTGVDVVRPLDR